MSFFDFFGCARSDEAKTLCVDRAWANFGNFLVSC